MFNRECPRWVEKYDKSERDFCLVKLTTIVEGDPKAPFSIATTRRYRVIQKTQKMVLDASLLNTQLYKVRIKDKCRNLGKGVAPSTTPQCI